VKILLWLLVLTAAAAPAQNAVGVTGPIAGFVFDPRTHDLRPMFGVPGASYLGTPLAAGLDLASVSPDGTAALGVSGGRLLFISSLRSLVPASTGIEGAIGDIDRIAWSPDGALAAIYSSQSGQAQIVQNATRAPAPAAAIPVAGTITALGLSVRGDLAAATEDGVYLLIAGAQPQLLASATRPVAIAVRGSDLFLADTGADRVLLIENFVTAPAVSIFAEGVDNPVGLEVSADGKRLLVASARTKTLTAFDVAGRYAQGSIDLDCTPSGLKPFGARDLWLLNSDRGAAEPLYVATGDGDPAAWFVPAGREQ
jgi:hypothetical protein